MKKLILAGILLGSAFVYADPAEVDSDTTNITQDTVQENEAINAPTSVMQNTQVNSGVTHDYYGGGVACAKTTLQGGLIQSFNGEYDEPQIYIGFNMPLGEGADCERAASKQASFIHQRTRSLEEEMIRKNESHDMEQRKSELKYADLLAKVCLNFHGKLLAKRGSFMDNECSVFSPTKVRHGHEEADKFDEVNYTRVADHTHHTTDVEHVEEHHGGNDDTQENNQDLQKH